MPVIAGYVNPDHPYRPEDDGYLVLIEPGDVDRVVTDLDMPYRLPETPYSNLPTHAFKCLNSDGAE